MVHLILSPLSAVVLAVVLLLASRGRPGRRWLAALSWVVAGASLLLMTPLGANALIWSLERRVPPPTAECLAHPPATVVLLSGGFDKAPRADDDYGALSAASVRRLTGALQLLQRLPDGRLVIAGGGPFGIAESTVLGGLAQRLGVAGQRLVLEKQSLSTADNIAQVALLQPAVERRIWLVSSALHLPRAVASAERAGFSVCAEAVDHRYIPPGGPGYYLPQSSALAKSEDALHELVGGLVYAWR